MASRKAGKIVIDINAGTAQFLAEMDKANAKIGTFGQQWQAAGSHGVSSVQATSGALRVLEGGLTNNLRAAERFVANVLGFGPLLQAAFPIVGAIAFAGLLVHLDEEAKKLYDDITNGSIKAAQAFRSMGLPLSLTNDELRVTNDRLANEIDKLEGRRQNTLALALDEARQAADKLAESLEKDIEGFAKLAKEENVSFLRRFAGEAKTSDISKIAAADAIHVQDIDRRGQNALNVATLKRDIEGQKAAQAQWDKEITDYWKWQEAQADKMLAEARDLAKGNPSLAASTRTTVGGTVLRPGSQPQDERQRIQELEAYIQFSQSQQQKVELTSNNTSLKERKDSLEAAREAAKIDRPLDNKLAELDSQIAAAKLKLSAAGLGEAEKVIASAEGEALKAIEEVNRALSRQSTNLKVSPQDEARLRARTSTLAATAAEEQWRTKLAQTNATIRDQVQGQELLTAAIGKGYEAVKKASVELDVMRAVGAEKYNDPAFRQANSADVDNLRTQLAAQYEAKHAEEIVTANQKLDDQITLERRLAQVQAEGAAAVELATLQVTVERLRRDGQELLVQKMVQDFYAKRANQSAAEIGNIDREIEALNRLIAAYGKGHDAVVKAELQNKLEADRASKGPGNLVPGTIGLSDKDLKIIQEESTARDAANAKQLLDLNDERQAVERLTAARLYGAEAVRKAEIENHVIQMRNAQASPEDIAAYRQSEDSKYVDKIAETASQRVNYFKEELATLEQERTFLEANRGLYQDQADLARALKDIENERLKIIVQQDLAQRGAIDGVRAFFHEMEQQAKSSAQIIYDVLNSALDRTSDNLAKLFTGQGKKSDWAKEFQDLGQQLAKESTKSLIQTGLGKAADAFGLSDTLKKALGLTKRNDGQDPGTALWVRMVSGSGTSGARTIEDLDKLPIRQSGTIQEPPNPGQPSAPGPGGAIGKALGGLFGGGSLGGGIFSLFGNLFSGAGGAASGAGESVSHSIYFGGFRAAGGPVSPSSAYVVGENGPEVLVGASGRVVSNSEVARQFGSVGGSAIYNIDARGADLGAANRIKRGIVQSHQTAVAQSVQATVERGRRVPGRV